jgi:hypothetical protein
VPDRRKTQDQPSGSAGELTSATFFGFRQRGRIIGPRGAAATLLPRHINQHFSVGIKALPEFSLRGRGRLSRSCSSLGGTAWAKSIFCSHAELLS